MFAFVVGVGVRRRRGEAQNNRCQQKILRQRGEEGFYPKYRHRSTIKSSSLPLTTIVRKESADDDDDDDEPDLGREREREGTEGFFYRCFDRRKQKDDDAHLVHVDSLLRFGLDGKISRLDVGSRLMMMITTQRSVRIRRRDRVPRGNTASIHRAR